MCRMSGNRLCKFFQRRLAGRFTVPSTLILRDQELSDTFIRGVECINETYHTHLCDFCGSQGLFVQTDVLLSATFIQATVEPRYDECRKICKVIRYSSNSLYKTAPKNRQTLVLIGRQHDRN